MSLDGSGLAVAALGAGVLVVATVPPLDRVFRYVARFYRRRWPSLDGEPPPPPPAELERWLRWAAVVAGVLLVVLGAIQAVQRG